MTIIAAPWSARARRVARDAEVLIGQSCQLSGPLALLAREILRGFAVRFSDRNHAGSIYGEPTMVG